MSPAQINRAANNLPQASSRNGFMFLSRIFRGRIRAFGLLMILFVSNVWIAETPIAGDDSPTFQQVIEKYFARWTKRHQNELLTGERVHELVLSSEVKGAEAAAIAAIHCYQKKLGKDAHPLSRAFLLKTHAEQTSLRRDQAESGMNVSHNYSSFLRHIKSAPRRAFEVERPSLDTITQGHLGDCYFVAAVGAQAHRNPQPFLKLIHANDDRSYAVRFPNGHHVTVPMMTDAQLALGSNAGQQGIWLNILELAAGIAQEESRNRLNELPLDVLGGGGDSVFSIELLTGHQAVKHRIRHKVEGKFPRPSEKEVPELTDKFTHLIRTGLDHHRLICCGIGEWTVPPGLIKKHVYAILGMNHGQVEIWNPWGYKYHFEPKGRPGLQHGYFVEGGKFSVPMHDFVQIFGTVNIESDQPVHHSKK